MPDYTCFDCAKLWLCKVGQDEPDICGLFEPKIDEFDYKAANRLIERSLDGEG